jgi:hypothetical protein
VNVSGVANVSGASELYQILGVLMSHGYADMNISIPMDIFMNLTDMNTVIFSWIIHALEI